MDWSLPPLEAERQGGSSQSWRARGIFHQTVSRLPVANQVSLESWMVDICQEVHSQEISSPEETHSKPEMALWRRTQKTEPLGLGR